MSDFLKQPWVQRLLGLSAAAGLYLLAHKFPDSAKDLVALAGLAALVAREASPPGAAPKADQ